MSRDFRLLLLTRTLRAFGFGFAAVLIGLYLEQRGLQSATIGITLAIGLLAAAVGGLVAASAAARIGRRKVLAATGLLMAITGLDLALVRQPWLLAIAGVTGMLGAASVDLGPFASLEQAVLAESVLPQRRNVAFGRYAVTGGLAAALGSLVASLGTNPTRIELFFLAYAVLGVATSVLPLMLSPGVEVQTRGPTLTRRQLPALAGLSGLFAIDSLGGGLVVQSVIAYWLHVRFGAEPNVLGPAFTLIALVQAASYEAAARLANRIGLIRTMVFTHLPSNLLLMAVPLSPSLPWALAILIARFSISQMDVPARQAYVASIVPPAQRAGAIALTSAVRGVGQAFGPILAGVAIQAAAFGLPFFLAGGLKITYDIGLYLGFRTRPADHEVL